MPTIVGIFIFISRENFMLSGVEHEKKFYNLGAYAIEHSFQSGSTLCVNHPAIVCINYELVHI